MKKSIVIFLIVIMSMILLYELSMDITVDDSFVQELIGEEKEILSHYEYEKIIVVLYRNNDGKLGFSTFEKTIFNKYFPRLSMPSLWNEFAGNIVKFNNENYMIIAGRKANAEKLKVKYVRDPGVNETIVEMTYVLNDEYYIIFEPLFYNSCYPIDLTELITFYDKNENDITTEFWYKRISNAIH